MVNAKVIQAFMQDRSLLRIIKGPVGSGKSTACCLAGYMHACEQEPSPTDDYRRFKFSVIRNTMVELRRTTLATWASVFDERYCGPIHYTTPASHEIIQEPSRGQSGLIFKAEFFGLDRPQDIRTLLSYEPTALWFNEIREAPEDLVRAAMDRAGRYPSIAQGGVRASWFGVMGDTNPPDDEHWIADLDRDQQENVRIFHQPPGVIEVHEVKPGVFRTAPKEAGCPQIEVGRDRVVFQADKSWAVNPDAENLSNLPVAKQVDITEDLRGKGSYYLLRVNKPQPESWIRSYYQGKYAFVAEGKPVIEEFNANVHVMDNLAPLKGVPLTGGLDVGGGTLAPAAIIGQRHPRGLFIVLAEVSLYSTGIERFSQEMLHVLAQPRFANLPLGTFYGDPAGAKRDEIYEDVVFDFIRAKGIPVVAAQTNDIAIRVEATRAPFLRLIDGKPGVLIDRGCKRLIKGLSGAWKYKKIAVPGQTRYADKPDKGAESHTCDSLGYWFMGEGEYRSIKPLAQQGYDPNQAHSEYDYFGD
jgi:hypothetical protein